MGGRLVAHFDGVEPNAYNRSETKSKRDGYTWGMKA